MGVPHFKSVNDAATNSDVLSATPVRLQFLQIFLASVFMPVSIPSPWVKYYPAGSCAARHLLFCCSSCSCWLSPPFSTHCRISLVFHFASPSHQKLVPSHTPNQPWNLENSEVLLCACFLQCLSSCLFGCQLSRAHTSSYSVFLSDFCIDSSCPWAWL